MQKKQTCPCYMDTTGKYYCRILHTVRTSGQEEICSICPLYGKQQLVACQKKSAVEVWMQLDQRIAAGDEPLFPEFMEMEPPPKAFLFAAVAHQGQYRKGTDIPYLIHLIRTWDYVRRMTSEQSQLDAALLHDVLEDTDVTKKEIMDKFGKQTAALVVGESEKKRKERPANETWKLRKMETIDRLARRAEKYEELPALRIAFADKLANLYSMAFEYRQIGDTLWNKFNQKDKKMHAWYYGNMQDVFVRVFHESEPALIEEYKQYYQEVFGNDEV